MSAVSRKNATHEPENALPADPRIDTPSPTDARKIPRFALSKAEVAASLGCSVDFAEEHVLPELRVVRRGRRVFVPVAELERWLAAEAALTLRSGR
jgi:hypothetical protein